MAAVNSDAVRRLVQKLGGWPDYFGAAEIQHGESLVGQLVRDRVIDETVFAVAIRYAVHRAAFDKLSAEIRAEDFKGTGEKFLGGNEQRRAFHENKLAAIERELLATPYARAKQGQSAQTSFMDLFDAEQKPGGDDGGPRRVLPFQPMARRGGK